MYTYIYTQPHTYAHKHTYTYMLCDLCNLLALFENLVNFMIKKTFQLY